MSFMEDMFGLKGKTAIVAGVIGTMMCGALLKAGAYANGNEKPRIDVVSATSIPEEKCRQINQDYLDPALINIENYWNREEEGLLYVDHAGEILYKLKA